MKFKEFIRKTTKTGLSVVLCSAIVLTGVIGGTTFVSPKVAHAAWDGYKEDENASAKFELLDFNKFGGIMAAGAVPSRKNVKDCTYSAHWTNHTSNGDFWIKDFPSGVPSDWTTYNAIEMKIYSEKATDATIMPVIYSPDTSVSTGNYYSGLNFSIDWEGWKTVKLDLSKAAATRKATWKDISQFRLVSNGNWSIVGNPETDIYIASITLKGVPVTYNFTEGFYDELKIEQAIAYMQGSVAVYAGAPNAVTGSGTNALAYRIERKGNRVMVPVKIFADYLGATVSDDGNTWSVTLAGKTVSSSSGSYVKDSMTYIDGEKVAKELGLSAFLDGKLLVMGTQETYNALKRVENLGVNEYNEIVAQKTYPSEVDFSKFTEADCNVVLERWLETLVGSKEANDLNDPDIASKIASITTNAKATRNMIIRKPVDEIFEGVVSTGSDDMSADYGRVYNMAMAYACPGSELYKDVSLKKDIIFCLDWLYEHRFSVQGRENWKFTGFNNWYAWDIGAASKLVPTLICLKDEISLKDKERYLEYYTINLPMPKLTGGNYAAEARNIIGSALLRNDYKKVLQVQADFQKMYLFVDDNKRITESQLKDAARVAITPMKGAGYFTDGSYILHTLHAMNGTYGLEHYEALVDFENIFAGTSFEMQTPLKDNLLEIFYNGVDALLFGTTMYTHVLGRGMPANNAAKGVSLLANMFEVAKYYDDDIRDNIYSIVRTAYYNGMNNASSFISSVDIGDVKHFKEVMADESIPLIKDKKLSKIYYNIDKSVHERDDWAIGVSMSSARIFNYECINSQNMTGWYLGDGRTEYYLNGETRNANMAYWGGIDPYRLPGTTVDTQERKVATIAQGNEYLSSKHFVGGVSLGGEYGASAMHLESYHNEIDYPAGYSNTSYGGPAPAHKNDLVAQKSYYMLDDGVICLGTGVNAKDNNNAEVLTIIENLMADETVNYSKNLSVAVPYEIKSAVANVTPEPENIAPNTIDGDYNSKWAGEMNGEIVWDTGAVQELGFAAISLQNGTKRQQYLTLQVSADEKSWETVFEGASSGKKDTDEVFDLKGKQARYVKYINRGNSAGSAWVSIGECKIYPLNPDGTIGLPEPEIYGADEIIKDGEKLELAKDEVDITDATWLSRNGVCGYYFPKENSENLGNVKARWTRGNVSFLEIWTSHGVNPTDSRYSYVLLPGATTEETKAFAEGGAISILSNTNSVQAAKDNRTGITYITFWEKGTFGGVTVDQPCMIVMQETADEFRIAVSDPTQKLTELNVKFVGVYTPVDLDEAAQSTASGNSTTLKLNVNGSAGRTLECVYKK